jgi:hypothetical protein
MNDFLDLRKRTSLRLKGTMGLFLAGTAAFMIASDVSAKEAQDAVSVQAGWAYIARGDGGAVEHVAATRAAEDAAWLLLACSADERLIVSLIHTEQFPCPLNSSSSIQLRSNNVPTNSCTQHQRSQGSASGGRATPLRRVLNRQASGAGLSGCGSTIVQSLNPVSSARQFVRMLMKRRREE